MVDIVARVRSAGSRSFAVSLSAATGWPRKGESISVFMAAAGQMKKIEGTVVELEPRTPVSTGRLLVRDSSSGELVELPAPMLLED
jgi:hypothetical protein